MSFIILKQMQEKTKEDCLKNIENIKIKHNVLKYEIIEKQTLQGFKFLLKVWYKEK